MQMPLVLTNRRRRGGSASAPAFSPSTLYSSGSQGIWLDPSDLTTMFSDRAGTTAVVTPGTVVGLRLDKSKGLALGAELVTNGTFDANVTGWSGLNTGTLAWNSGRAQVTSSAFYDGITQTLTSIVGRFYAVSVNLELGTAATARVYLQNSVGPVVSTTVTTAGVKTITLIAQASTTGMMIRADSIASTGTFFVDNISVRELAGNHAVAPTDAARPTYGVEPKGGRRNTFTQTNDITNLTNWPNGSISLGSRSGAGVSVSDPQGYVYISRPTSSSPVTSGVAYTFSATVVCNQTISNVPIRFAAGFGVAKSALVNMVAGVEQRVALTGTATSSGNSTPEFGIDARDAVVPGGSNATGYVVTFSDPQLELGSTATAYQRVTTAYDVTESGVATTHYVQYDGSDDSMSTAAIDFTATDKMSVFAGVRSLADHDGVIVETSAASWQNSGAFALGANSGGTGGFFTGLSGSLQGGFGIYAQAAPSSDLLAALFDIGAAARSDESRLRVDSTSVTQTFSNNAAGTGNFGNYPLFIGRRNNATLPFNGKDYGIIVVGKTASAGEITDTELWLAAKTSGVTL